MLEKNIIEEMINYFSFELTENKLIYSKLGLCFYLLFSGIFATLALALFLAIKSSYSSFVHIILSITLFGIVIVHNYLVESVLKTRYSNYNIKTYKMGIILFDNHFKTIRAILLKEWLTKNKIELSKINLDLVKGLRVRADIKRFKYLTLITLLLSSIGAILLRPINYIYEILKETNDPYYVFVKFPLFMTIVIILTFFSFYMITKILKPFFEREYILLNDLSNTLESLYFDIQLKIE